MAEKPNDRKRNELKKLQARLEKSKSQAAGNDEMLADLDRNMLAQKRLAEWQGLLRDEQEVLVRQLKSLMKR